MRENIAKSSAEGEELILVLDNFGLRFFSDRAK